MRYFDHDTTANSDDKLIALRMEHGGASVDCYWAVLEKIYRDEAPLILDGTNPETKALCFRLMLGFEKFETYIESMISVGLLVRVDGGAEVHSERAAANIEAYREKCEIARQNGKKGGRKPSRNQVGTKSVSDGQAKKRKEKKGIGSHKGNQIPGADGAGGDEPAPLRAVCPRCGGGMQATGFRPGTDKRTWLCDTCGPVADEEVA